MPKLNRSLSIAKAIVVERMASSNIMEVLNLISNGSLNDCHALLSKNLLMNDRSLKSPYVVEQNHELFE
jgi:hypothetical protein